MIRAVVPGLGLLLLVWLSGPLRAADMTSEQQAAADRLHRKKCARCHRLYDPADYDEAAWHAWMRKMRRKARLKPEQYELLTAYTDRLRREEP